MADEPFYGVIGIAEHLQCGIASVGLVAVELESKGFVQSGINLKGLLETTISAIEE